MKIRQALNEPPESYYNTLAQIESGNNPNAQASTSSAAGLYQFTRGTWKAMVKQMGLNYTLRDRFDPIKAKEVVTQFTKNNEKELERKLGRKPNEAELYLAHFSGIGGASDLLTTIDKNPNTPVTEFVSSGALKANKSIFYNKDGSAKKASEIYDWSAKKFDNPKRGEVATSTPEETKAYDPAPYIEPGARAFEYNNKSANATYADITAGDDETPKTVEVKQNGLDESQVRKMLDQERSAMESKFMSAIQQNMPQQQVSEEQYAQPEEDLYNYVNIENFAKGGKLPDEKDFFNTDKNKYLDEVLGIDRGPNPSNKNPFGAVDNKSVYEELSQVRNAEKSKTAEVKKETNPFPKTPEGAAALDYNNFMPQDDFSSKPGIERVQNKLIAAGYDLGATGADGDNGPKTKAAYESYIKKGRAENKNYFGEVKQGFDPFQFGSTGDEPKKEEFGTKTEIEQTQRELIAAGYDLGKYGKNKDGVDGNAGEKTRAAKKDYDSISNRFIPLNSDTDIIEYQKNLQNQGNFQGIDVFTPNDIYRTAEGRDPFMLNPKNSCGTKFCTAYVGEQIEAAIGDGEDGTTGGRASLDAYGDAWTYNERILNKGGKEIFSVFEDKKPDIKGGSAGVEKYIQGRLNSNDKVKYNDLQAGDTLNLFYPGSSFAEQAYKEGTKYFTSHAGMIKKNSKGELFVEHNVGGKVYKSPLQDFIDGKAKNAAGKTMAITAVVRPNYKDLRQGNKDLVNSDNVTNKDSSLYGYNHSVFTETLRSNSKALTKDLSLTSSEFDGLSKAMRSIAFKESDYGDNNNNYSQARHIAGNIREFLGAGEKSRGLTSLKDKKNLPENLRSKYVKGKGDNLNNPAESAIPSFYALGARYKYLKDLNVVKKLGMKQEDITKLAMLAWNEDVSVVAKSMEKYKTYDSVMKAYRGSNGSHDYDLALVAYQDYLK
tara:strand:- start:1322 stop:4135 length:2814 start_codon:yes stop_codon:yes gene_type:complete